MLGVEVPTDGAQRFPEFLKCLFKVCDVVSTLCTCFSIKQPLPLCLWLFKVKVVCKIDFTWMKLLGETRLTV